MFKKTICFDFDGVIHSYTSGWKGPEIIPDPPVFGAKEALEVLRKDWQVVVHSSRCGQQGGREAIIEWLLKHEIIVDMVCNHKPPAVIYIDDRGIQFKGQWPQLLEDIANFKHWMKAGV